MRKWIQTLIFMALFISVPCFGFGSLFAKGSVSKNYTASDEWRVSVTASGGIAITLIPRIRVEARYTNITSLQNKIDINSSTVTATLTDVKTQTAIYSVGIDVDILGQKSAFQPFLFLGGGYLFSENTYNITFVDGTTETGVTSTDEGVSLNVGAGFRLRLARALALELEVFAVSKNIRDPNPLINLYGTAGVRIYL